MNSFVICFPKSGPSDHCNIAAVTNLLGFFWNYRNSVVHQNFLFLNIKQCTFYLLLFTGSSLIQSKASLLKVAQNSSCSVLFLS